MGKTRHFSNYTVVRKKLVGTALAEQLKPTLWKIILANRLANFNRSQCAMFLLLAVGLIVH